MITSFGPQEVKEWTEKLGQQIFVGTSGRVFPKVMKASPYYAHGLHGCGMRVLA